jgi:DNA repair protein RadB
MLIEKVSAGSYDLNKFLGGGYEKDIITTIYGPGGSGKSNLCLCACTNQAKKGNKVIFVDTEGGFSVERFFQIHGGEKEEAEQDIENVLLLSPTSFNEQEKGFENLLKWIKSKEISLIIIDSMVMLYRLELGDAIKSEETEKIKEVNRKLAKQLRTLNEIARKRNIPVLVTNQVYLQFVRDEIEEKLEREVSMVGGDLLKYWSKCLIELQQAHGKRKAILRKHRSQPNKEMHFDIVRSGIRKHGLF